MSPRTRIVVALALLAPGLACAGPSGTPSPGSTANAPPAVPAAAVPPADGEYVLVEANPAPEALFSTLATYAAEAKGRGLRPYVEFWATWCGPCMAIRKSMGDPRMQAAFAGTYIVQLDADVWSGRLDGTGFSASSIPVYYEIDGAGRPTGRSIDGGAWGDNIPENMAPPLGAFFHAP